MATAESFLPADGENEWAIEPQGVDGGTASGAGADDRDSGPAKMGGPRIAPWVKECGIFPRLGIEPDLAAPLRSEQETQAIARFSAVVCPPAMTGTTWSR